MPRSLALVLALLLTPVVQTGLVAGQQGVVVPPVSGPTPQPGVGPGAPPGFPAAPGGLPPRDQGRRTGSARIRGRIIASDSGQPLRRATVRASASDIREMVSTVTDAEGLYELKDLPAGRYIVTASKGSYATLSYGQTRAAESGRPLEVKDNQTLDRIDLRLPRGGVITGVVLDEFGEPMPDAQVSVLRLQYISGRRRLLPAGRFGTTNDIGAFRLFGLAPGNYYLSVSSRPMMVMMVNDRSDDRTGYAPTYYPGTSDVATAQRLTVAAGQTLNDINVSLVPTQTARVSGIVLDAAGQRVRMGMVMAMPRGGAAMPMTPTVGPVGPDGTFTINGVAPGEHTLRASLPPDASGTVGTSAVATISVSGQDVTGVQLTPAVPSALSGRIILDGGAVQSFQGPPPQLMFNSADLEDFGPGMLSMPPRLSPQDDLSFETKATAGRWVARLMAPDGRWSLKAVRHQGVDVTDQGVDVRPGQDVSGVEVELTSQRQEISGLVTAAGKQTSSYTAVVFAQDRELWRGLSRYIAVGRPDQEGRFRVRNLPPGDYYVAAVEYVEQGAWTDPDFLESVRHAAVSASLGPGETKTVDLRLADPR